MPYPRRTVAHVRMRAKVNVQIILARQPMLAVRIYSKLSKHGLLNFILLGIEVGALLGPLESEIGALCRQSTEPVVVTC